MNKFIDLIKKVKWNVDKNNCWIVYYPKPERQGYILIQYNKKRTRLHRVFYEIFYSKNIDNKIICHTCDNKSCVNPDHLYEGTKKSNTQDMIKRNRYHKWKGRVRQKLTRDQIIKIRHSPLSSYKLACLYNVTDVQIRRIKNGSRCKSIV